MAAGPAEPEADSAIVGGRSAAAANAGQSAELRFEAVFDASAPRPAESGAVETEALENQARETAAQKVAVLNNAPAPQPANRDDARGEPRLMRTAAAPPAEEAVVALRKPEFRDGTWYEAGYTDQPVIDIARNAEKFAQMIDVDKGLRQYLTYNDAVVLQFENQWYRLKPAP